MQAVLVNPWIYDFASYDLFAKPIGLLQIGTYLKRIGFKLTLIDCLDCQVKSTAFGSGHYYMEVVEKPKVFKDIPRRYKRYGMPPELFRKLLKGINRPDIILVTSGMTYWYKGVFEAIEILKKQFPKTPLLLGGIYATLCYEHALRFSGSDFVFKGRFISNGYLSPCYELYPKLNYVSLRTSTGCPYRCSYCGWYLLNPEFSQRDPEEVIFEIEDFYKKLGVRNFAFYDDALFYNPDRHIKRILKGILRRKIFANFHTPNGLHARFLDRELASLLKKSNFVQPRLGFETVSTARQKSTGGKVNSRELISAIKFLKEAGFEPGEIGVYLLIGLPNQSFEEIEESIYFVHSFKVRVYLEEYSPVPGTADYKRSVLDKDIDPLLHNNSVFPLYNPERFLEFQRLKELNHRLNQQSKVN